jgi:uncharacterized protein (DUF2236 family)
VILSKEECFKRYLERRPWTKREVFEEVYAEEIEKFASKGVGVTRLKDVKEFWLVMAVSLPEPTYNFSLEMPWLYDVDWHFDRFDEALEEYGKKVPKQIIGYIRKASTAARGLYNDGDKEAAWALMMKVFNLSWTRKNSIEEWAKQFDD